MIDAGRKRELVAEISRQLDRGDARIRLRERAQRRPRRIAGTVVNEYHLDRFTQLGDGGADPAVRGREHLRLAETRDRDAQQFVSCHGSAQVRPRRLCFQLASSVTTGTGSADRTAERARQPSPTLRTRSRRSLMVACLTTSGTAPAVAWRKKKSVL